MYPVPPKVMMVNAAATIDLPCWAKVGEPSMFNPGNGQFGWETLLPSIKAPPPPKKEITEAFWVYGDASMKGRSSHVDLGVINLLLAS